MGKSTFLQDFKAFAMKGNVIDMAVGVGIGGGVWKIVSSLVSDIIMPPIGMLVGGMNFSNLHIVLQKAHMNEATGKMVEAVTLNYGNFIQTTIDFLIIAFSIFIAIKFMNKLRTKKEETPAPTAPPAPSKEEVLLTEIRDILKDKHW